MDRIANIECNKELKNTIVFFYKMFKTFYFEFTDDYRSGPDLCFFAEDDVEVDDYVRNNYMEVELELCKDRIYVIYLDSIYQTIIVEFNTEDAINKYGTRENFKNKIFTMINGCLPFEVTGMTTSYKETGFYPKIPEDISNMKEIEELKPIIEGRLCAFTFDTYADGTYSSAHTMVI